MFSLLAGQSAVMTLEPVTYILDLRAVCWPSRLVLVRLEFASSTSSIMRQANEALKNQLTSELVKFDCTGTPLP